MKYPFVDHLIKPNTEEEKWRKMWWKGKREERVRKSKRNEDGEKRG